METFKQQLKIINKVIDNCKFIFGDAWKKEQAILKKLAEYWIDNLSDLPSEAEKIEAFCKQVFDYDTNLNKLTATQTARFYELLSFVQMSRRYGIWPELKAAETRHFNGLTAKLHFNLCKYIDERFDDIDDVEIHSSAKGFVVLGTLYKDGMKINRIRTSCVPAGGHNIQSFHFRYITKLLKINQVVC